MVRVLPLCLGAKVKQWGFGAAKCEACISVPVVAGCRSRGTGVLRIWSLLVCKCSLWIFQPFVPDASPVSQGNGTQCPVLAVTLVGEVSDSCCSSEQPSWDSWAGFLSVLSSSSAHAAGESSQHQLSLLQRFPLGCWIGCTEMLRTDPKPV